MISRRAFLTLSMAAAGAWSLPVQAAEIRVVGGSAFGSYWRLTLGLEADPAQAAHAVATIVARVDEQMSPFRTSTDISRFNALRETDWQPMPEDFRAVVVAAQDIFTRSRGAFDPGVGPTVNRYGFGPVVGQGRGAFDSLELRGDAVRKGDPALTLDFCGIAKGYALDLMVSALADEGFRHFYLELGGEVLAKGRHPSGRDWYTAVEGQESTYVLALNGRAIATSGDTINGFTVGGRRYGHIIDPTSDAPAIGDVASVSVIHGTACAADGWATALMALGLEDGAALAEAYGLPALFQIRDGAGMRAIPVAGFETYRVRR